MKPGVIIAMLCTPLGNNSSTSGELGLRKLKLLFRRCFSCEKQKAALVGGKMHALAGSGCIGRLTVPKEELSNHFRQVGNGALWAIWK